MIIEIFLLPPAALHRSATLSDAYFLVEGRGNSTELSSYTFIDHNPYAGTNYYRLVQYDFDGEKHVSPVRVVYISEKEKIKVYPNPSANQFNVLIPESLSGAVLSVTDILGREIFRKGLEQEIELSLGTEWPNGTYVLHWISGTDAGTMLLVKE